MSDRAAEQTDFSGIWHSIYHVPSGSSDDVIAVEHYVLACHEGNQLLLESLPSTDGSYMLARLSLDGRIATGGYESQKSPKDGIEGAIYYYYGTAQLILDPARKTFRGKGVGFGRNLQIKVSEWELRRVQHPTAQSLKKAESTRKENS